LQYLQTKLEEQLKWKNLWTNNRTTIAFVIETGNSPESISLYNKVNDLLSPLHGIYFTIGPDKPSLLEGRFEMNITGALLLAYTQLRLERKLDDENNDLGEEEYDLKPINERVISHFKINKDVCLNEESGSIKKDCMPPDKMTDPSLLNNSFLKKRTLQSPTEEGDNEGTFWHHPLQFSSFNNPAEWSAYLKEAEILRRAYMEELSVLYARYFPYSKSDLDQSHQPGEPADTTQSKTNHREYKGTE